MSHRVIHEPSDGDEQVLATDVEFAESLLARSKGLMFRSALPEGYALVLEMGTGLFGRPARQGIHMLFVRMPIDVVWLVEDEVQQVKTLRPWVGMGAARADRILELPAGSASAVEAGDTVSIEQTDG